MGKILPEFPPWRCKSLGSMPPAQVLAPCLKEHLVECRLCDGDYRDRDSLNTIMTTF